MVGTLLGGAFIAECAKAWKADDIEKASLEKNSKAFGKQAEARTRVQMHQEKLFNTMKINAMRKNAILQCHIKKFIDVYKIIDEYKLNKGLGIEELEKIEAVKMQMVKVLQMPSIAISPDKSDAALVVEVAVLGIGGSILKDAKDASKLASRNMASANAASAQADSICIWYDGLAERIQTCTDILQKLSAKDIIAINHIESMIIEKGMNESLYTQHDVDSINLCSELNILIYEIINTPLIDQNNEMTKESIEIINKGQVLLQQLG